MLRTNVRGMLLVCVLVAAAILGVMQPWSARAQTTAKEPTAFIGVLKKLQGTSVTITTSGGGPQGGGDGGPFRGTFTIHRDYIKLNSAKTVVWIPIAHIASITDGHHPDQD